MTALPHNVRCTHVRPQLLLKTWFSDMNLFLRLAPLLTTCCLLITLGQTLLVYEDTSLLAPRLTDSLALFL